MNDLKASLVEYLAPAIPRLFSGVAPPGTERPFVTMQFISSEHRHHMGGSVGFCTRRVQFDVYGNTSVEVDDTFEALRNDLDGFGPYATMGTTAQTQILSCWLETERDGFIDPTDSAQLGRHRRIVEFMITHRTSIPEET